MNRKCEANLLGRRELAMRRNARNSCLSIALPKNTEFAPTFAAYELALAVNGDFLTEVESKIMSAF